MPDAPPPKRDRNNLPALALVIGHIALIAFVVGAVGLDAPTFPDQYLSPLYWGRRLNDAVRGENP